VILLATTIASALSKPLYVFVLPVFGLGLALALGPRRIRSWLVSAALLVPSAAVLGIWSLVSNAGHNLRQTTLTGLGVRLIVEQTVTWDRLYLIWHKTFWECVGWLDTWLRDDYYTAVSLAILLAVAGFAIGWRRLDPQARALSLLAGLGTLFLLLALHAMEILVMKRNGTLLIQGRYLLPLFPLQAVALVFGLRGFSRRLGSFIDGGWAFGAMLLVLDAATIGRALVRYYA
jgi:hypothetical protein